MLYPVTSMHLTKGSDEVSGGDAMIIADDCHSASASLVSCDFHSATSGLVLVNVY
jgi:hypothetical protein